jgi:hypothetical protein
MTGEAKNILVVAGVAILMLYLFRKPAVKLAKDQGDDNPYGAPDVASMSDAEKQENAAVALAAMEAAINAGESKSELNKLNSILYNEKGVKVFPSKQGGLMVTDRSGQVLLER